MSFNVENMDLNDNQTRLLSIVAIEQSRHGGQVERSVIMHEIMPAPRGQSRLDAINATIEKLLPRYLTSWDFGHAFALTLEGWLASSLNGVASKAVENILRTWRNKQNLDPKSDIIWKDIAASSQDLKTVDCHIYSAMATVAELSNRDVTTSGDPEKASELLRLYRPKNIIDIVEYDEIGPYVDYLRRNKSPRVFPAMQKPKTASGADDVQPSSVTPRDLVDADDANMTAVITPEPKPTNGAQQPARSSQITKDSSVRSPSLSVAFIKVGQEKAIQTKSSRVATRTGTGFLVTDRHVLTAFHVLSDDIQPSQSDEIVVVLNNETFSAELVEDCWNASENWALLKLDRTPLVPPLALGTRPHRDQAWTSHGFEANGRPVTIEDGTVSDPETTWEGLPAILSIL